MLASSLELSALSVFLYSCVRLASARESSKSGSCSLLLIGVSVGAAVDSSIIGFSVLEVVKRGLGLGTMVPSGASSSEGRVNQAPLSVSDLTKATSSTETGIIIYKAPSPGGPVEIFEIPESPSNHVPSSPGPSRPVPPLPAPSGPSSSSSWTEDSFELRVLSEPFSETEMEGTAVNSSIPRVGRDEAPILFPEQAEEETTASHANPAHDQGAVAHNEILEKIDSRLQEKLVRYSNRPSIVKKFPTLDFQNVDFAALTKEMAQGEVGLDVDYKSTQELINLYPELNNMNRIREVMDAVLEKLKEKSS